MEKCIWDFKIFGHYIRFTEERRFKIIGKRKGQWRDLISIRIAE